jgi:hypothetical protein
VSFSPLSLSLLPTLHQYPSFLIEGETGISEEDSAAKQISSQGSVNLGLTLRKGLRWQISPTRFFRYPSLQFSFPRLFPRLASSGWTHSFVQHHELDGADLQLGDIVCVNSQGDRIQVIGNFHKKLSSVSGVCRYVAPNVHEFTRLMPDGVE